MKPWGLRAAFRCMAVGLMSCVVGSGAFAAADAYDFDYRISGHTSARPVQVFADTERTYFQFVAGQAVPLILAGPAGERVVPVQEGPYHVVAGRSRAYTLRLAGRQARVEHAGKVWMPPPAQGAVPSVPLKLGADDRTLSSYATPVRGDVIEWVEPEQRVVRSVVFPAGASLLPVDDADFIAKVSARIGPDVRVEVQREGDARPRALAEARFRRTAQALVRAGVSPARIESVASMGRPVRGNFDILLSDGTVATSLRRWAQDSGYRLEWDTPIEAPIVGDLTLDARRFPEAVERIVTGLRESGYPLRMEAEDGQVVRIKHEPSR